MDIQIGRDTGKKAIVDEGIIVNRDNNTIVEYQECLFQVSDLSFFLNNYHDVGCYIGPKIIIGDDHKHITLHTKDSCNDDHSIEYSLISAGGEYPILPLSQQVVRNERLFPGLPTRFPVNDTKPVQVKRNNVPVNYTIEEAKGRNDGRYTVDYTPHSCHYLTVCGTVQVKAVVRIGENDQSSPMINEILLKKAWKEKA